jgi:putative phosphonate metabolism protein
VSEGDQATGAVREGALNEARAEPASGRGREPGHERGHLPGPGSGHVPEYAPRAEPVQTASPWLPSSRFALYYAPSRGSPWWDAGCRWLGRDPETGTVLTPPRVPALEARGKDVATLSRAPARYGWHGTLVAPSRCAPGVTPEDVLHEALEWAQHQKAFELSVEAASLGRFVALRPATASDAASIAAVAADALHTLACLRAVATGQETRRRLESDLTVRQRELLERWGYPYVLDEFRFHMTLSDSIDDDDDRATLLTWWHAQVSKLGALHLDSAALFVEPEPGAPFVLWARLPFGGRG